jgi:hypothetical protein
MRPHDGEGLHIVRTESVLDVDHQAAIQHNTADIVVTQREVWQANVRAKGAEEEGKAWIGICHNNSSKNASGLNRE